VPKRYISPPHVKTKLFELYEKNKKSGGWQKVAEEIGFLSGGYWWFIAHEQRQLTKANYMRFMARFSGEDHDVELPAAEPIVTESPPKQQASKRRRVRRIEEMSRRDLVLAFKWREPY
jgi:hypothetical protein